MRELTVSEVEEVSGGLGVFGGMFGFAIGAGGAYVNGGSFSQMAASGVLGGLSGAAGNFAGSAAAGGFVLRSAWGVRSVGLGISSNAVGGRGGRGGIPLFS